MANTAFSPIDQPGLPVVSGAKALVATFFFACLVLVLAARGAFVPAPGAPPLGLLIGLVAPLALFFIAYRTAPAIRDLILSADLRLIAAIQAWRWAGSGFLTLFAYRILPGIF